jgi:hypothetical protein
MYYQYETKLTLSSLQADRNIKLYKVRQYLSENPYKSLKKFDFNHNYFETHIWMFVIY